MPDLDLHTHLRGGEPRGIQTIFFPPKNKKAKTKERALCNHGPMAIEGGEDAAAMAPEGRGDVEEVRDDGDDEGSGEGLGNALPAARVKRIMRKNPDKKKNFSKETVLAVSMATVPLPPCPAPKRTLCFLSTSKNVHITHLADDCLRDAAFLSVGSSSLTPAASLSSRSCSSTTWSSKVTHTQQPNAARPCNCKTSVGVLFTAFRASSARLLLRPRAAVRCPDTQSVQLQKMRSETWRDTSLQMVPAFYQWCKIGRRRTRRRAKKKTRNLQQRRYSKAKAKGHRYGRMINAWTEQMCVKLCDCAFIPFCVFIRLIFLPCPCVRWQDKAPETPMREESKDQNGV